MFLDQIFFGAIFFYLQLFSTFNFYWVGFILDPKCFWTKNFLNQLYQTEFQQANAVAIELR